MEDFDQIELFALETESNFTVYSDKQNLVTVAIHVVR